MVYKELEYLKEYVYELVIECMPFKDGDNIGDKITDITFNQMHSHVEEYEKNSLTYEDFMADFFELQKEVRIRFGVEKYNLVDMLFSEEERAELTEDELNYILEKILNANVRDFLGGIYE